MLLETEGHRSLTCQARSEQRRRDLETRVDYPQTRDVPVPELTAVAARAGSPVLGAL